MSATYDKKDEILTLLHQLNFIEEELVGMRFDAEVDFEIEQFLNRKKEINLLKRICLVKTICFLPEIVFTYLFLGGAAGRERIITQKYYWEFLRNKSTLEIFKYKLNSLLLTSTLGK